LPPFWLELLRVLAPDVLAMMHHMDEIVDFLSFPDIDGRITVWAPAARKCGVTDTAARVDGNARIETEYLFENVLEVGAGFEISKG